MVIFTREVVYPRETLSLFERELRSFNQIDAYSTVGFSVSLELWVVPGDGYIL